MKRYFTPELFKNKNDREIFFGDFPFWQGVQIVAGVKKTFPFRLGSKNGYPIQQVSDNSVLEEVVSIYKSDGYDYMTPPPGKGNWADELGENMIQYVQKMLSSLENFQPKNILEVGAGTSYVAKRVKELYPVEQYVLIDPSIREVSSEFEIIREYFPHPRLHARKFDLVLSFNTLEHVTDPKMFLKDLRSATQQSGNVVLIYPDCEHQIKTGDLNVLIHEHISYFTEDSTRSLMAEAGFTVVKLESFNDTFAVLLQPNAESGEGEVASTLNEQKLLEQSAKAFEGNITKAKRIVDEQLSQQSQVGFHGATNALNIFLFLTGLGSQPGIQIYDGDDNKVGKYLPASSIRIQSSKAKTYQENDVMIVSAMSYFEAIRSFATEFHRLDPKKLFPMSRVE